MPLYSQGGNPERFTARHWMFVPVEGPSTPSPPRRGLIAVSGVALVNFSGTSAEWQRDRVTLDLEVDVFRAIEMAPWRPSSGHYFVFVPEQWVPLGTLNARYNAGTANNDGSAVDAFNREPGHTARLSVDLAVRDVDAIVYRVGYHLSLYGRLEEWRIPG